MTVPTADSPASTASSAMASFRLASWRTVRFHSWRSGPGPPGLEPPGGGGGDGGRPLVLGCSGSSDRLGAVAGPGGGRQRVCWWPSRAALPDDGSSPYQRPAAGGSRRQRRRRHCAQRTLQAGAGRSLAPAARQGRPAGSPGRTAGRQQQGSGGLALQGGGRLANPASRWARRRGGALHVGRCAGHRHQAGVGGLGLWAGTSKARSGTFKRWLRAGGCNASWSRHAGVPLRDAPPQD